MSNSLERTSSTLSQLTAGRRSHTPVSRQTSRALVGLDENSLVRAAGVRAESYVQAEKLKEVDHLARTAMGGQAMLRRWADTLAAGDPFVADELKFFTDVARMGKGEIIADTIDTYSREGRRYHR
jgi:hypothetical protein